MPARPLTPKSPVTVLNARTIAAERGIFKIEELHRRLQPYGIELSSSQLGKVLRNQTKSFDTALLWALCELLEVTYNELLAHGPKSPHAPKREAMPRAAPRPAREDASLKDTTHDSAPTHPSPPSLSSLPKRT